ncbi:MAG: hypothetical protein V4793_05445 [Paraburkholderia tropica]
MSRKSAERKFNQTADEYQRTLVSLLKQFSYGHHLDTVFRDFVEMAALAISNRVDRTQYEAREKRYMEIVGKYKPEEVKRFPEMFAALTGSFDARVQGMLDGSGVGLTDVLGETYMMLGISNDRSGQFFTLCAPAHNVNNAKSKIMQSPPRGAWPGGHQGATKRGMDIA